MIHPSRLKYSSDYATTTNDSTKTFTVVVPDTFTVSSGVSPIVDYEFEIGSAAASMRVVVKSSRTGLSYPCVNDAMLPAKVHSQLLGDIDSMLVLSVVRSAPRKVRIQIFPNYFGALQSGDEFYDMGQTLTFSISTFLSPFFL